MTTRSSWSEWYCKWTAGGGVGMWKKNQCLGIYRYIYHYRVTENSPVLLYKIYLEYSLSSQFDLGQERWIPVERTEKCCYRWWLIKPVSFSLATRRLQMLSVSAKGKTPREENYWKWEDSINTVSRQNSYEKLSGWKSDDPKFQETTCWKNLPGGLKKLKKKCKYENRTNACP